ncbi:uncharacterized protein [Temnothorax nylanderi]|uniref:uncharacterized protein n=1 Tax=Temnothorax nylanderi TaxID=102681 RepID=UPI003A865C72
MADEIRALVQRRATIKAQLTRFKGYLEKWSERPDEQQLIERFEKFKTTWDSFDEVQKRRLAQEPQLREEYTNFLNEYERLGHVTEISVSDVTEDGYFIPHHPVFKRDSHTTKLRVVFNASSKSSSGVLLNDVLLAGPTLQEDLFSIVTRFRTHRYALSADIEKMYRQVGVHPEDVKYQMILWRKSPKDPIKIYGLSTATYGTVPIACFVVQSLLQLYKDERKRFPLACRVLLEDFYIDDALTGTSKLEEAQRLRDELIKLLACGGFHLRKWCSNEPSLLEPLLEKSMDPYICLSESETQKTLGIHWHPRDDHLIHVVKPFTDYQRTTKKTMLSQVASLFDSLGLVGPVIVRAKIMLQRLWENKLDWDESISVDIATSWNKYKEQIELLNNFVIPRQITTENAINIQLHGFCDASEKSLWSRAIPEIYNLFGNPHSSIDLFQNASSANQEIIFTPA